MTDDLSYHGRKSPISDTKKNESTTEATEKNMYEILNSGILHLERGDHDEALEIFTDILANLKVANNNKEPKTAFVASVYHYLGVLHSKRFSDPTRDKALGAFHNSIYIRRKCLKEQDDPFIAMTLVQLGILLIELEDYGKSRQAFQEAIKVRTNVFGLYHPLTAKAYINLGIASLYMKKYSDAIKSFKKAYMIQRHMISEFNDNKTENHHYNNIDEARLDISYTLCNIASLVMDFASAENDTREMEMFQNREAWQGAEKALEEALSYRISSLGEDHPLTSFTRMKHEASKRHNIFYTTPQNQITNLILGGNTMSSPPPKQRTYSDASSSDCDIDKESGSKKLNQSNGIPSFGGNSNKFDDDPKTEIYTSDDDASNVYTIPQDTSPTMGESKFCSDPNLQYAMSGADSKKYSLPTNNLEYSLSEQRTGGKLQKHSFEEKSVKSEDDYDISLQDIGQTVAQHSLFKSLSGRNFAPSSSESPSLTGRNQYRRDLLMARTLEDELYSDNEEELSQKSLIFKHIPQNIKDMYESAENFVKAGEYEHSLQFYNFLLPTNRQCYGELHPLIGFTYHEVGMVYLLSENYPKAVDSFERAVIIRKGAQGKYHPSVSLSLNKLGVAHLLQQNYDQALSSFEEALNARSNALGNLHPTMARIHNNIGCVYLKKQELQKARNAFEQALDVQHNAISTTSDEATISSLKLEIASTLSNLGYLYRCRKMFKEAVLVLQDASKHQEDVYSCNHMTYLITLDSIADTYLQMKSSSSSTKALEYYGKMSDILCQQAKLNGSSGISDVHRTLSLVLHKTSRIYASRDDNENAHKFLLNAKEEINKHISEGKAGVEQQAEHTKKGEDFMRSRVTGLKQKEYREKSERLLHKIENDLQEVQDKLSPSEDQWI